MPYKSLHRLAQKEVAKWLGYFTSAALLSEHFGLSISHSKTRYRSILFECFSINIQLHHLPSLHNYNVLGMSFWIANEFISSLFCVCCCFRTKQLFYDWQYKGNSGGGGIVKRHHRAIFQLSKSEYPQRWDLEYHPPRVSTNAFRYNGL